MRTQKIYALVLFAACISAAALAEAQTPRAATPAPRFERVYLGIGGGYQGGVKSFTDSITFTQYLEPARVDTEYRRKNGPAIDASGAVRVWRNLAIGAGFSSFSKAGSGEVTAEIPHPFFFQQTRPGGAYTFTGATHQEKVLRVDATVLVPAGRRTLVMISAGPAFVSVTQQVVSSAQWTESGYPYDSPVVIEGVNSSKETSSKVGFAGGMDVGFYFSPNVGAGFGVRFVRAKVPVNERVRVDAGGLQASVGLRLKLGAPAAAARGADDRFPRIGTIPYIVTANQNAPVYATNIPAANLAPLSIVPPGTVLEVIGQDGDWLHVRFEDPKWGSRTGWVQKRQVTVQPPPSR